MKREQLVQLIRSIFRAQEEEILCSEFFESLPGYVDFVLGGEASPVFGAPPEMERPPRVLSEPKRAQVAHHMAQCPECAEAYEALLQLAPSAT